MDVSIEQDSRWEEVNNAILKMIRMDRKHSSFDLVDETNRCRVKLKVKYGQAASPAADDNEHALKAYWRHLNNFYFKRIDEPDVARLAYLQDLMEPTVLKPFEQILTPVANRTGKNAQKNYENLVKSIEIKLWRGEMTSKQRKMVDGLRAFMPTTKGKFYERQLVNQAVELDRVRKALGDEEEGDDEIENQLRKCEAELSTLNSTNRSALGDLKVKVDLQVRHKQILYHINNQKDVQAQDYVNSNLKLQRYLNSLATRKSSDLMCSFLRGFILKLEKAQVADSISKVLEVQKFRNEYMYRVSFEPALNVGTYQLPESEFLKMNSGRQISLVKFYNTALKSPYTHISHNFAGFGHLSRHRSTKNPYKNSDLVQLMHKTQKESSSTMSLFSDLETCHHCKQLYPKSLLNPCSYRSSKTSTLALSSDNFLVDESDESHVSTSRCMRKKQGYMSYTKKGDQYVCLRKYCRNCVSQYYQQVYTGDLCPFCQSACFCTRCQRNQTINKLKRVFVAYGGDLGQIHTESLFEKIVSTANQDTSGNSRQKMRFRNITEESLNDFLDNKIYKSTSSIKFPRRKRIVEDEDIYKRSYHQLEDKQNELPYQGQLPRKVKKLR